MVLSDGEKDCILTCSVNEVHCHNIYTVRCPEDRDGQTVIHSNATVRAPRLGITWYGEPFGFKSLHDMDHEPLLP